MLSDNEIMAITLNAQGSEDQEERPKDWTQPI